MKKVINLSKSKIMQGLQCAKSLYLSVYSPDLAAPISDSQQALFDQGHEVGLEAQKLYPGGKLVKADYWNTKEALDQTESFIKEGIKTIFEATKAFEGVSARADILHRKDKNVWEIIEVKSSTSVKDEHLYDAAIQLWVFRKAGLKIDKISIMHINNKCTAPIKGNLFTKVDVTKDATALLKKVPMIVYELKAHLEFSLPPIIDIGPHCMAPYECPFIDHCWKHIPVPSAFDIPRIGNKVWELYKDNKIEIKQLNEKNFNIKQARVLSVLKTGKRFIDKEEISKQLKNWQWPIYFLDFESFNPAIPIYKGTHPYQQIPFQFSCHVLEKLNSKLKHFEYLHTENSDPRERVARALAEGFGEKGSIVAYNKKFENGVLMNLAAVFPKYRKKLTSIASRLVDPWPILEASVYDKDFLGSYSLKSVAPALLGKHMSYEGMAIDEGGGASLAYLNLIKGQPTKSEREKTIKALLEYCRQDTLATVELVKWLFAQNEYPRRNSGRYL
ncbi:MAG: DUF2779 domain-containing protein [Oligoflexia bacterium]|nr:DUF2779 domain-containing protein [Oligoflexia bacterium]